MHPVFDFLILAAKKSSIEAANSSGGKGMSLSWAVVLIFTIIGVALALSPAKRTYEVKREKH